MIQNLNFKSTQNKINKSNKIFFILDIKNKITHDTKHCNSEEQQKKKKKKEKEKKLDYITIDVLHTSHILNSTICTLYIRKLFFIHNI